MNWLPMSQIITIFPFFVCDALYIALGLLLIYSPATGDVPNMERLCSQFHDMDCILEGTVANMNQNIIAPSS